MDEIKNYLDFCNQCRKQNIDSDEFVLFILMEHLTNKNRNKRHKEMKIELLNNKIIELEKKYKFLSDSLFDEETKAGSSAYESILNINNY